MKKSNNDSTLDILSAIKMLIQEDSEEKDNLILLLISKTKKEIESICNTNYISQMDNVLIDMVYYKLNTLNTDGIKNISYSDVMRITYSGTYPQYILKQLNNFKKNMFTC